MQSCQKNINWSPANRPIYSVRICHIFHDGHCAVVSTAILAGQKSNNCETFLAIYKLIFCLNGSRIRISSLSGLSPQEVPKIPIFGKLGFGWPSWSLISNYAFSRLLNLNLKSIFKLCLSIGSETQNFRKLSFRSQLFEFQFKKSQNNWNIKIQWKLEDTRSLRRLKLGPHPLSRYSPISLWA